jgi:hypothetical protein
MVERLIAVVGHLAAAAPAVVAPTPVRAPLRLIRGGRS